MSSRRSVRQLLVAVLLGVLVGGGLMAVTPAGAEVSQAAATSWKKVWKKKLKPLAAKTFHTKAQSDARYQPKGSYEPAGSGYAKGETWSRAEADARYAGAGSSYAKAESDGKYAPAPTTIRGSFLGHGYAPAANGYGTTQISFPSALKVAPVVHLIDQGAAVPTGCSGTAAAPGASPGHMCIFVAGESNVSGYYTCSLAGTSCALGAIGAADPWGLTMYVVSAAAGRVQAHGSWALNTGGVSGISTSLTSAGRLTTPDRGSPAAE